MQDKNRGILSRIADTAKRVKCEIWTRAMGYCRPVSNFNKGKQSEFHERKYFTEDRAIASSERLDCK